MWVSISQTRSPGYLLVCAFQDTAKWRYGIQKILPLNYAEEAQHLMQLLESPWAQ